MNVSLAFLADAATVHPDGKLSALGLGVDTINTTTFPTQVPSLAVVVKVEFSPTECDRQHVIEVVPLDADGKLFSNPLRQPVTPPRNAVDPTLPSGAQAILNYLMLQFTKAGAYAFSIIVDGREVKSLPLRVVMAPAMAGGIAPSAS